MRRLAAHDAGITDEELTALALAADHDTPLEDDATPFDTGGVPEALLPSWYMPPPGARRVGRGRRVVIAAVVGALVLINAAGLCVTYGFAEIAW